MSMTSAATAYAGTALRSYLRTHPRAMAVARRIVTDVPGSRLARAYYEAANRGRLTDGWTASSVGPQTIGASDLRTLRDRARSLERDDPHGHRFVSCMANNIIGEGGVAPNASTGDATLDRAANLIWQQHAPLLNADGTRAGWETIAWQGARAMVMDGESIALRRIPRRPSPDGIRCAVRLVESDLLDHTYFASTTSGGRIVSGIELDADGVVARYHLYSDHPSDYYGSMVAAAQSRVAVDAADVAHLYIPERPGQRRGIPLMAAAMRPLYDLTTYRRSEITRKQMEAMLAAIVYGGDTLPGSEIDSLAEVLTDADNQKIESFRPGMVAYMHGGKDVKFNSPASAGGYREYLTSEITIIAASLGMPYALLSGDLSQTNYSSIRAGLLDFYQSIKLLRRMAYQPLFCQPIWDWVMESAYVAGRLPEPVIVCDWNQSRFRPVDPMKEAQADLLSLKIGSRTLAEIVAETGRDFDDVLEDLALTNEKLAAKSLHYEWQDANPTTIQAVMEAPNG